MALTKCKECGVGVSKKAAACPSCGAPARKKTSRLAWLVAILLGAAFVSLVVTPEGEAPSRAAAVKQKTVTPKELDNQLRDLGLKWRYDKRQDKMSGGTVERAWVKSLNTVEFSFPYSGKQRAALALRTHPRYGRDVILSVEKGQFVCGAIDGCEVVVRFGDAEPVAYLAKEPESGDSNLIFIQGHTQFMTSITQADKVIIEAGFYKDGRRAFEFDVSNLRR